MRDGVNRVNEGVTLAMKAGDAMGEIQANAGRVVETVGDISTAMREQSSASSDIARNVERIAQMAEENNASVAENAATARAGKPVGRLAGRDSPFPRQLIAGRYLRPRGWRDSMRVVPCRQAGRPFSIDRGAWRRAPRLTQNRQDLIRCQRQAALTAK